MMPMPAMLDVPQIQERLRVIFPHGITNRNYVTREIAAKTVFVLLYVGAIGGTERWLRPDQITRMTDAQAALTSDEARQAWQEASVRPDTGYIEGRWYATNTREPIRDETLREGFVRTGAVKEREGLPTTSPRPRYALDPDFAALFHPALAASEFEAAVASWQDANLSGGALARVAILRRAVVASEEKILVAFPNGEARYMEPGPSSVLSKAVIEEFATRFLESPGVIWLSESRNQIVARDDQLAQVIGLSIQPDRHLPDLILVDIGPSEPLLVFVEIVATAGSVNESRRNALLSMATEANFREDQVAFVTAFADRDAPAFKASVSELAWRSFVWFASEPEHVMVMHRGSGAQKVYLSNLM